MGQLGFRDYFRRAFWDQFNLIPLGGFAVAGFFNPGFWILGAAYEVAYLAFVPTNDRWQRKVRAEFNQHLGIKAEEEQEALFRRLSQTDRSKFGEIQAICYSLEGQLQSADPTTRSVLEESFNKLGYLMKTYLRLLVSLGTIRGYRETSERDSVLEQIKKPDSEVADPKTFDRVKEVKRKNIEILKQRLSRIDKARENEAVIEANLSTLEDTLKLIRDNALSLSNPQGISNQINNVVVGLEESERVLKDIEQFASIEDSVGGGDAWERETPQRERE